MPEAPDDLAGSLVPVRTRALELTPDLTDLLDADHPAAWIRDGYGLVGWGVHAVLRHTGSQTLTVAEQWFSDQLALLDVDDEVARPGTGPVALLSAAFDPATSESVFVIPEVVVGRDEHGAWVTVIGAPRDAQAAVVDRHGDYLPLAATATSGGSVSGTHWQQVVAGAVDRIRAGALEKVVLARDLFVTSAGPIDERTLVRTLTGAYPSCWTFTVDGLTGATPELLASVHEGALFTRILAGTEWGEGAADRIVSAKNRAEHDYAARSAATALEKVAETLDIPDRPEVLTLPNLVHLATEIHGTLAAGVHPLEVIAAMHPTAAVGGTPTDAAVQVIAELEPVSRGRYAGPVGWFDAAGNCEFGIALRSGQLADDRRSIHLYAGCGIVAESDPATELAESSRKFGVMLDALGTSEA